MRIDELAEHTHVAAAAAAAVAVSRTHTDWPPDTDVLVHQSQHTKHKAQCLQ